MHYSTKSTGQIYYDLSLDFLVKCNALCKSTHEWLINGFIKFFNTKNKIHIEHTLTLNSIPSVPQSQQPVEVSQSKLKRQAPIRESMSEQDAQTHLMWNEGTRQQGDTITGVITLRMQETRNGYTHSAGPAGLPVEHRDGNGSLADDILTALGAQLTLSNRRWGLLWWFPLPHVKPSSMRDVETWATGRGERQRNRNKDQIQTEMTRTETREQQSWSKLTAELQVMDDALLQSAALNHSILMKYRWSHIAPLHWY